MATAAKKTAAPAAKKTGTAVAVKKSSAGALVSLKEKLAAQAAALNERTAAPGGDKIKLSRGKFKLPDGSETDELQIVIVDFLSVNSFYEGAYDPNNISPPACFAIGTIPTQLVASDNSPNKQSDACSTCPMNQFGSSGNGKACKNGRRLAVLPPDADEDTPMWILDVSPTGLKGFDGYVRSVSQKFGLPPIGVLTTVSMDASVDYPKLVFSDPQPNENLEVHFARSKEAMDRLTQEPDVSQYGQDAPPPARGARKPAARGAARR